MTKEVYLPKLGDVVYVVIGHTIERTLICGLHSKEYHRGDYSYCHGRCAIYDVSNTLSISILADADKCGGYCYHKHENAVVALKEKMHSDGECDDVIEIALHEIFHFEKVTASLEHLRSIGCGCIVGEEDGPYYLFDREKFAHQWEAEDVSCSVSTTDIKIASLEIDADVWFVVSKELTLNTARLTDVDFWAPRGYIYACGTNLRQFSRDCVFATKDEALDYLAQLFAQKGADLIRGQITAIEHEVGNAPDDHDKSWKQIIKNTVRGSVQM